MSSQETNGKNPRSIDGSLTVSNQSKMPSIKSMTKLSLIKLIAVILALLQLVNASKIPYTKGKKNPTRTLKDIDFDDFGDDLDFFRIMTHDRVAMKRALISHGLKQCDFGIKCDWMDCRSTTANNEKYLKCWPYNTRTEKRIGMKVFCSQRCMTRYKAWWRGGMLQVIPRNSAGRKWKDCILLSADYVNKRCHVKLSYAGRRRNEFIPVEDTSDITQFRFYKFEEGPRAGELTRYRGNKNRGKEPQGRKRKSIFGQKKETFSIVNFSEISSEEVQSTWLSVDYGLEQTTVSSRPTRRSSYSEALVPEPKGGWPNLDDGKPELDTVGSHMYAEDDGKPISPPLGPPRASDAEEFLAEGWYRALDWVGTVDEESTIAGTMSCDEVDELWNATDVPLPKEEASRSGPIREVDNGKLPYHRPAQDNEPNTSSNDANASSSGNLFLTPSTRPSTKRRLTCRPSDSPVMLDLLEQILDQQK